MTSVPPLSQSIGWTRGVTDGRNELLDLQRQLATGKKAATYGDLGPERTLAMAMRERVSSIDSYKSTIETVSLRLDMMDQAMARFSELGSEIRSDAASPNFELIDGDRTGLQARSENALEEALSLMRSEVGGRHLFAGRDVEDSPVASMDAILDGEGGKAGFRQHLDERRQADLGADGLGRLELDRNDGAVTVGEDHDGPFGFKITALSTDIAGATVDDPTGTPPEAGIDFDGSAPEAGDTVRVTLALPDGTETDVVLTAADGSGGDGTFAIGADGDATAANFEDALTAELEETAAVDLSAASAHAASDDFFDFDGDTPPQRVDGPPFDQATELRDANDDTVIWYTGEAGPGDPRQTAVARIDDQVSVSYGARANEEGLRGTIQNFAVLAAESFDDTVDTEKDRYLAVTDRTVTNLSHSDGRESPDALHSHIASAQHALGQTDERHDALRGVSEDILSGVEDADINEVATKILQLQTRLQASYETTSILSQMSLVFHM